MGDHASRRRRLTAGAVSRLVPGISSRAPSLPSMESEQAAGGRTGEEAWIFPARVLDDDLVEAGRLLFAGRSRFVAGAAEPAAWPPEGLPEIAFAGRSNVGKSSLVNALTGRRLLARISNTPGRTRQINFFDVGGRLRLVDLPGYGFAEAPKSAVRAWSGLVERYLQVRAALRRVCLLLDARRGLGEVDRHMLALFDRAAVSYQIVLTKSDKVAASDLAGVAAAVAAEIGARPAAHPDIHLTSALKQRGIADLRMALAALAPAAAGPAHSAAVAIPDHQR